MKSILDALKHAERRLNEIPHTYADTDFRLITKGINECEKLLKAKNKNKDKD